MIKFSGRVNNEIKKKIIKQRDRQLGWLMFGVSILGVIATLLFSILDRSIDYKLLIPTTIVIIITVITFIAPQFNSNFRIDWTYTVSIEKGKIYKVQYQQPNIVKDLNKIKRVIDNGKWYTIIYSGLSNAIICQKDLLIEGTLEEFESLFQGKIKRKLRKT